MLKNLSKVVVPYNQRLFANSKYTNSSFASQRFLHGKNIIACKTVDVKDSKLIYAMNPKINEKVEPGFQSASPNLVEEALDNAVRDFSEIKKKSPEEVATFLRAIADEISAAQKEIFEKAMLETAYAEARVNTEFQRTVNQLHMFAKLVESGTQLEAKIQKVEGKPDLRRILVPLGPVVVLEQFPLAYSVCGGDTASALAAQCPVIVKAHHAHPATSEVVAECIVRAQKKTNYPSGVFSLIHGSVETGVELVKNKKTKAVGFTGSTTGGRALFDIANKREEPIPVYAEMGSVNPVVIMPDALQTKANEIAEGFAASLTLSVGQFCTNPGIVITVGDEKPFVDHLSKLITQSPPGIMLTSGMRDSYLKRIKQYSSMKGVRIASHPEESARKVPNSVAPAVVVTDPDTFLKEHILQEENFGPSTVLVACKDIKKAQEVAQSLAGQLTGTIHATEKDLAPSQTGVRKVMDTIQERVGRMIFNGYPTGVEVNGAQTHGGPYPATSDSRTTAVGTEAIKRWLRPVTFQNSPQSVLPLDLQNENKRKIWRSINDVFTKDPIQ